MNKDCLELGIIQAFVDGELPQEILAEVSVHLAKCDACLDAVSAAESEMSDVFAVMERELAPMVPTQRLWTRINEQIEGEKHGLHGRIASLFSSLFLSPSMAAAAAIVLTVTVAAVFLMKTPESEYIASKVPANSPAVTVNRTEELFAASDDDDQDNISISRTPKVVSAVSHDLGNASYPRAEKAIHRAQQLPKSSGVEGYFEGEEVYLKTISSIRPTVDGNKDSVLSTSERIAYERELAVIEDAIARTRKELKRDPKNSSARQVLLASYQNKVDLMNSVVQREELMASLK